MSNQDVLYQIKALGQEVIPQNARLMLYGSRARNDWREDSDWDLLLIIPKQQLTQEDYDNISYPFTELGWRIGQTINPVMYTQKEWEQYSYTPFYHNVLQDAITLQ